MTHIIDNYAVRPWAYNGSLAAATSANTLAERGYWDTEPANGSLPRAEGGTLFQYELGGGTMWYQRMQVNTATEPLEYARAGQPGAWEAWVRTYPPEFTAPAGLIAGMPVASGALPGWLLCDGSLHTQAAFPLLYAAIGQTWGGVVGNTFRVPDLRDQFLRGASGTYALGNSQDDRTAQPVTGGTVTNTHQHSHSANTNSGGTHRHSQWFCRDTNVDPGYGWSSGGTADFRWHQRGHTGNFRSRTSTQGNHTHSVSVTQSINHSHSLTGGGDAETRPINMTVLYYISDGT